MSDKNHQIDVEKTQKFAQEVFSHLAGALVSGMIHLGERMGLYRALNGAGPLTSEELARKTGLNERWVREWLYQQAAAKVIDYRGESRFELSPEAALVLADENSPFFPRRRLLRFPAADGAVERTAAVIQKRTRPVF